MQTERGEEGTLHYQAFAQFSKALRLRPIKAMFGNRVHIGVASGNAAQNIRYCTKLATRVSGHVLEVVGSTGKPRNHGGIVMMALEIQNGMKFEAVALKYPGLALNKPQKIRKAICKAKGARHTAPEIIILMGPTGCGKSHYVDHHWGSLAGGSDDDVYWASGPGSGKRTWWGDYCGQDVVILDEFHAGWFPLCVLLRFWQGRPFMVQPKGDQVPFNSHTIVVTSNVDPVNWYRNYSGDAEHKRALATRIRLYAKIYDCVKTPNAFATAGGRRLYTYTRVLRTREFEFAVDNSNFLRREENLLSAGVGDMSSGNGF